MQPELLSFRTPIATLELYLDDEKYIQVAGIVAECRPQICLTLFAISILDSTTKVFKTATCYPRSSSSFLQRLVAQQKLIDSKDPYLPMGILSLQVECMFATEVKESHDENIKQFSFQDLYLVREMAKDSLITETRPS